MKSSPGGHACQRGFRPLQRAGAVVASAMGSRRFSSRSATFRVVIISETVASLVLITAVAWTVTDSTTLRTFLAHCGHAALARELRLITDLTQVRNHGV